MKKIEFCTFQQPDNGIHIGAIFERKKLILEPSDTLEEVKEMFADSPELIDDVVEEYRQAAEWCKKYSGMRFDDSEAAERFLHRLGVHDDVYFELE